MSETMTERQGTNIPVDPVHPLGTDGSADRSPVYDEEWILAQDSDKLPVLSIVMPTLNEEQGISECITRIKHALEDLNVTGEIIVSDSSTDRTPEIAAEMGAVVVTPDKPGYGYAYRYAFAQARGEYIAIGDADTTYDFEELPKLYRLVAENGIDMALGSRLSGTITQGAMPLLHRYVGNPLLTKFLNVFYGAGVSDAHSGFRVIRRDALDKLDLRTNGMEFASEMIMDAGAKNLTIDEVPITYHKRVGEATLSSFSDGWRHVKFMLLNAPNYLFTIPCSLCGLIGVLFVIASLAGVESNGITFSTHTMIVGSLFLIIGYQVGSLGVFSAIAGDPIKPPVGPLMNRLRDNFRLEHGAITGVLLFGLGVLSAGHMTLEWLAGRIQTPFVVSSLLAYTAIILGVQTIFNSFYIGILRSIRENDKINSLTDMEGFDE